MLLGNLWVIHTLDGLLSLEEQFFLLPHTHCDWGHLQHQKGGQWIMLPWSVFNADFGFTVTVLYSTIKQWHPSPLALRDLIILYNFVLLAINTRKSWLPACLPKSPSFQNHNGLISNLRGRPRNQRSLILLHMGALEKSDSLLRVWGDDGKVWHFRTSKRDVGNSVGIIDSGWRGRNRLDDCWGPFHSSFLKLLLQAACVFSLGTGYWEPYRLCILYQPLAKLVKCSFFTGTVY